MNQKTLKKLFYTGLAFCLLSTGISLQIKAGIGQSLFNAFSMLFSDLFQIQIGSVINFFNLIFFILYLFMKSFRIELKDALQILAILLNGLLINVLSSVVFSQFTVESYPIKIALFLLGITLSSISLGAILAMGIVRFPLEGLCLELSEKLSLSLSLVRKRFDLFFLASTLILTLIAHQPLYIREGTIMSFFLLSKIMGASYDFILNRKTLKAPI